MTNRRALGRIPVRRVMKPLHGAFRSRRIRAIGQVLDVSPRGLFMATEELPEKGAKVKVVFEDASGARIKIKGTVRWNTPGEGEKPPGFGMLIEDPPKDFLDLCDALLDALGAAYLPV